MWSIKIQIRERSKMAAYLDPELNSSCGRIESTPTDGAAPPEEEMRADWTASAQKTTEGPVRDG